MIRLINQEDLICITQLEQVCFSDPWSLQLIQQGVGSRLEVWFILEEQGKIIGYSSFRTIAGEGEIQRIAIDPDFRGRGLGKKLMDAMAAFARKQRVTEVSLEVRSGNAAALNLYKCCGFREEAVRKAYYRNPTEDAIIMWNRRI